MTRTWHDSVLDAVTRVAARTGGDQFTRADLLRTELQTIVNETRSRGATPEQTLSRILQDLRDEGAIDFLGDGSYRLLTTPIHVELSDLAQPELDAAIRRGALRLGQVDTGTELGTARRRLGQQRVRALTLANYDNQCAVCDISEASLLVASHIVPWAHDADARGKLSNVLCLCRFHDTLFEAGYWSLSDMMEVVCRHSIQSGTLRSLLQPGIQFRTPLHTAPALRYIRQHRERHHLDREPGGD